MRKQQKLKKQAQALLLGVAVTATSAQAETLWSDNSLTLLHGTDYEAQFGTADEEMTTLTFEHVSGHSWGDAFMFIDRHNGSDTDFKETYGEIAPRVSLGKTLDKKFEYGPITDVLFAATYEFSSASTGFSQDNYLYGVGLDWKLPGFAFFQTNFLYANNENTDDDLQLTVVYGAPFSVGELDVMVDGYIDWSSAEDDHKSDFHFNPQVRVDVGKFMGMTKSKLEVGIEYSYWNNKFGFMDDSESVVSALVKFHL